MLLVNGTPVAAERESDGFTAATKFDPDDNEVLAVAKMPDGSEVRSARATSTVRLEPRPTARLGVKIDAGHVNFDSTASQPSEFDAAIKTWLVAPRKDNPAPLDLHETTPGIRSAVVPAADGEY